MQENLQQGRNLICKAADRIIGNKKQKGLVQRHSPLVLSLWGDGAFLQRGAIIILNEYSVDIWAQWIIFYGVFWSRSSQKNSAWAGTKAAAYTSIKHSANAAWNAYKPQPKSAEKESGAGQPCMTNPSLTPSALLSTSKDKCCMENKHGILLYDTAKYAKPLSNIPTFKIKRLFKQEQMISCWQHKFIHRKHFETVMLSVTFDLCWPSLGDAFCTFLTKAGGNQAMGRKIIWGVHK